MDTEQNTTSNIDTDPETSETSETSDTPPAPEAEAQAQIPGEIGKLTPEEQQALMGIRQESQQLLAKVGEHEVLKMRILAKLDELDEKGQSYINAVSKRLGLEEGEQWVALQNGTIRLVKPRDGGQDQGGAPASS